MKSQVISKRLAIVAVIFTAAFILHSCAVYAPQYQASLPVSEIVKMSRDGVPSKNIIRQIRSSHSVYELPASDLARLKSEGVQDSVLNYMQKTQLDAVRRDQRNQDSWYGYPGMSWYPYYGFGYPYYGYGPYRNWGWGSGPVIVIPRAGGEYQQDHGRRDD